jgi:superfamily I DNA/RNA helicase/Zn-dependent peptidase ImmA (M78 family)
MDSFDQVRFKASTLNASIIEAGADPFVPSAVVEGAAKALELDLISLPAGDPALKGARALYDDQSGTICFEESANRTERALLIAHEIGHANLHAGSSSCTASEIDPAQTSEASPTGIQRVEDYGAKERRELQANVYARELLLPRKFAAELHVSWQLDSREISRRTGLPLSLVRQQLFDALLLPQTIEEPQSASPPPTHPCDPSQMRAVIHRGSPYQLQAGPGTGKTKTLVARVNSLIEEGIDPAAILVLTFSNRAAGELYDRLAITVPQSVDRIWIGTFHSFGLDLVRRFHDKLALSSSPVLFDRSDAISVLEERLPTLPLKHYRNLLDPAMVLRDIVSAISRAKDEMVDSDAYRSLAETMNRGAKTDEEIEDAEKCLEIAHVYELYEAAKRAQNGVDFGDLIMCPTRLLEKEETVRIQVRLRHRHILVDEYQDVNRASARMLKAIADDGSRLWVVGDSRQSIYRFRGASSVNMSHFGGDYPGAKVDQLELNYRSTQPIVSTFCSFSQQMAASHGMLPLALTAQRNQAADAPEIRSYETLDDEIGGIAARIKELEGEGITLRQQAVLCRTNARLNQIASELEGRGIPVLHLGSLFEREEIRDLLALLALIVDGSGDPLIRVGAMERYSLSLQDIYCTLRHFRNSGGPAAYQTAHAIAGLTSAGSEAIKRLANDIAEFTAGMSPWDIVADYLLDKTDGVRQLAKDDSVPDQMRAVAVWQFLNYLRKPSSTRHGSPVSRVLDHVRQLVLLAEERDLRQIPSAALKLNAVRLMTVHGSKGLEFDAVHIPGLTVTNFPSSNRGQRCPAPTDMIDLGQVNSAAEHAEEEECLFFVALSRARDHLQIYHARKQRNGNARNPSPFLGRLPLAASRSFGSASASRAIPLGDQQHVVAITLPGDWSLTDSKLTMFERCPRRFFYTHVLGLKGARKATAFSQTHDCLYELMRRTAVLRVQGPVTSSEIGSALDEIWTERGPLGHAYEKEYRALAERLIGVLLDTGVDRSFSESLPLAVDLANGRIWVEPSDVATLSDGRTMIRRVRTGRRRSDEYDNLEYTLYLLAARAGFGERGVVQAVHLTDELEEVVSVTQAKLTTRVKRSEDMLASIAAGEFPPEGDSVTCPRCPHFFICAATPNGPLTVIATTK